MVVAAVESATSLKTKPEGDRRTAERFVLQDVARGKFLGAGLYGRGSVPAGRPNRKLQGKSGQCAGFDTGRRIGSRSGSAGQRQSVRQRVQVKRSSSFSATIRPTSSTPCAGYAATSFTTAAGATAWVTQPTPHWRWACSCCLPTSRIRRHQARRIRSTHKGLLQCQIELSVEKADGCVFESGFGSHWNKPLRLRWLRDGQTIRTPGCDL